jgi:hypothetical protein
LYVLAQSDRFARPGTPPDAETADADVALLRQLLSLT